MSFPKPILKTYLFLLLIAGLTSCVKDIDLDQAESITLQPDLQVDLLIFDVDEVDFRDPITNNQKTIIRDTVRLEFLDDDYIQNDLSEVEFSFKYINSFPQSFNNSIFFLSENNNVQHRVDFPIDPGSMSSPVTTERIELIEQAQIGVIRRSIKMVVEIEVLPNSEPFTGELKFQSKGLFSFQF
ncbi:hypothetical protein [Gillisia limnaea]|uniref:Secreted protein n=1 Tax=Gillisia limnaea (strain DSM 15749 / LMG 21470 / R-8282) TaxID=865937 RepID=H2BYU9_GILLR|nr:hypothetical protein [Gillisia limnaea]EHQ02251.1 secreted protein [Gillisia limnaea DSM 15749]